MKKCLTFALILFATVSAAVVTADASATPQAVTGTTLGGNIAKAHSGYRFVRVGGRQAQVEKISTLQIMGSYACVAPKGGNSSGCNLHVNPTVVECQGTAANGGVCQLRPHQTVRH
jgi:hypothetical protein